MYSHNDINNNNNNTNTSGTNEFISFNLLSLATREERRNPQGPMLTILCWAPHVHARRILWSLRSLPVETQTDLLFKPEKKTKKKQPRALTVEIQLLVFSKSSNSQDHLFRVRPQPHFQFTSMAVQPYFLSGGLLRQMMIFISFPHGRKIAPSDFEPELRDTE